MVQCVFLRCDPVGEPLKGTTTPLRNDKTCVKSSGLFEIFEIRVLNFVVEIVLLPPAPRRPLLRPSQTYVKVSSRSSPAATFIRRT